MRRSLLALPLAAALAVAGCAADAGQTSYDPATAQTLQTQVYTVTDLVSKAQHSEARAKLDELAAAAQAALSAGKIDQSRYDRIALAIAHARGGLDDVITAAEKQELERQLQEQQAQLAEQQAAIDAQRRQQEQQSSPGQGSSGNGSTNDESADKAEEEAEKKAEEAEKKAEEAEKKAEEEAEKLEEKNDD